MEQIALLALVGVMNIICFMVGAKVGQSVQNQEPVTLPDLNPAHAIQAHRERKEAEMEQDRIDTILRNIEAYDGTPAGQKDIAGR